MTKKDGFISLRAFEFAYWLTMKMGINYINSTYSSEMIKVNW